MGELPIRTGMTNGRSGRRQNRIPAEACTIANALKAQGYAKASSARTIAAISTNSAHGPTGSMSSFGYLYHLVRDGRPGASELSADCWIKSSAEHGPLLGDRHGRPDRDAALGKIVSRRLKMAGTL